jgi:hypothetical protein
VSADNNRTRKSDWRTQTTSFLLGAASGMATNLVSGATAYRAIAASVSLAALLTAASRLRTLPPRAPLVRHGIQLMLALSLAAAILTAIGPPNLAPYAIFVAVVLTGTAILVPASPIDRLRILGGVAAVGGGVAAIAFGIALLGRHWLDFGVGAVDLGVFAIGFGARILISNQRLGKLVATGCGLVVIGFGIGLLINREPFVGFSAIAGAACFIFTTWVFMEKPIPTNTRHLDEQYLMLISGSGIALIVFTVILLAGSRQISNATGIAASSITSIAIATAVGGVAAIGFGIALRTKRPHLGAVAAIGFGLATIGGGIALMVSHQPLGAVAAIGFGLAITGGAIAEIAGSDGFSRARQRITALSSEPADVTAPNNTNAAGANEEMI